MRALLIFAAMVALAGCSEYRREIASQPPATNQNVLVKANQNVITKPNQKLVKSNQKHVKPNRNVVVDYKGPQGFDLAVGKALEWCDQRFGKSDVHLVKNDTKDKRATFACKPL